jgi:UDP-2,3-diacylglucosamine pyrophosphatase LpxH
MVFLRFIIILAITFFCIGCNGALLGENLNVSPPSYTKTLDFIPPNGDRLQVFISDLHFGLGCDKKECDKREDFRWPNALEGFLTKGLTKESKGKPIDLIILGDFLDLWQPPAHVKCEGPNKNLGCSISEVEEISREVVKAHLHELQLLATFASSEHNNRLYIVPGNHDSALLLKPVWTSLFTKLVERGANPGYIKFVESGVWTSDTGQIVAEHGHQTEWDANRYDGWTKITESWGHQHYIKRTWGEKFVQDLFNTEERDFPFIDNLNPESAGVRYRMATRGTWGSVKDIAKFVKFNLLGTSFQQKLQILGGPKSKPSYKWNLKEARKLGYRLFLGAFEKEDTFRQLLIKGEGKWGKVQEELTQLASNSKLLPEQEIKTLCDQLALQEAEQLCTKKGLGESVKRLLGLRKWLLEQHLKELYLNRKTMRIYIYGHTHGWEDIWRVNVTNSVKIRVLNSGAFQRVLSEEDFKKRIQDRPKGELEEINLEKDFPPCYSAVLVSHKNGVPTPILKSWYMRESDSGGQFVKPKSKLCK